MLGTTLCRVIAAVAGALAVLVVLGAPFALANLRHMSGGPRYAPNYPPFALKDGSRITVTFDSLTVHHTRDGFPRGNGEYHVTAYVQGVMRVTDRRER